MANGPESRSSQNELAKEIDKLLKQLPGADPHLRGDPDPASPASAARPTASSAAASKLPEPSRLAQRISVWLRLVLAAGLAGAITQWPYAYECGRPLYSYLGAIAMVLVAGAWASVWAWRLRAAAAHVLALIVVFWGITLAAEQLLPRIGYAAVTQEWRCRVSPADP
jgi:hypothetical protein